MHPIQQTSPAQMTPVAQMTPLATSSAWGWVGGLGGLLSAQRWMLVLMLALAMPSGALAAAPQNRALEISSTIRREGDKTPSALFEELGVLGSAQAFGVLERSLSQVKSASKFGAIFRAMRHFLPDADLGPKAVRLTLRYAKGRDKVEAPQAANALASFGAGATEALLELAEQGKLPRARATALRGLQAEILERGDLDLLDLVLESWVTPRSGTQAQACAVLASFRELDALKRMAKFLGSKKASYQMRQTILRAMAAHPFGTSAVLDEGVEQVLYRGLQVKDSRLRYYALDSMATRGGTESLPAVTRLTKDKDPAVRRLALLVVLRSTSNSKGAMGLSRSSDPVARQAAAIFLAESSGRDALGALHALLEDENSSVRAEAIRQIGRRREVASILPLIECLSREKGRLRGDVHFVLTMMTGLDLGFRVGSWRSFWRDRGEGFQMPTLEEARKVAAELAANQSEEGMSAVSFYGLTVISDSFALVVDTSGSMTANVKDGKTRLDIAKEQINQAIKRIRAGSLFNIIPFSDNAFPMEEVLIEMDDSLREDSVLYVEGLRAAGGTNVYEGLAAAFEDEYVDTIYLLTDGDPSAGAITDPLALREEVERWNSVRGIRIHCISVGKASPLLSGIADDSGGDYTEVK
ncbi:HEAT repeat domain-containing protein [Planctomycetota bacterium]|nr:HEAT repeat domain-containing protein [Planctomycetota bacterium]